MMNRRIFPILILGILLLSPGCALFKPFVKDIDGWDLSACADREGFKTCKELFLDNQEKILGGKKVIDLILENMNNRVEVMAVTEVEENETPDVDEELGTQPQGRAMKGKWKWSTDEECTTCNSTGNRTDGVKNYCPICNGDVYLRKPNPADEWFLVGSREELWVKWLEYTKEPGCYDTFVQPKEYPCLAHFYSDSEADSWGKFVRYFYRENLPTSWLDHRRE